jgi:hypothetical protein
LEAPSQLPNFSTSQLLSSAFWHLSSELLLGEHNVNAEIAFISQISRIKRRVAVTAAQDVLLNAALIFLALQFITSIAAMTGLTDAGAHGAWYMVSIGISFSAAGLIVFATRRNFLHVLVDIDRRLRLQDRLSTAYEYLKFKKEADFAELLMQDAAAALRRLKPRQLLPAGFSWRHLIFITLLLADAALYMTDYPVSRLKSARVEPKTIEHARALLQNYTFSRPENKTGPPTGRQAAFSKLGDQLADRSLTSEQRFAALDDTLKEVQAERQRLADALETRLKAAGIQGLSVRQIPAPENLLPDQAAKLKELLNRALNSRIPGAVNEDIESLEKLESIAKVLSRLMDDARKNLSEFTESGAPADDEIQASQTAGGHDRDRDDRLRSTPDDRNAGPDRSSPDRTGESGSGRPQDNDGAIRDDAGLREGISASAGRGEAEGEVKSSAEIEKSAGPAIPDKMASSSVKSYLIHIRALPDSGEARLKEKDIRRTYSRAVESILQKEDIPLNYREYIKNYFMSIGLNTEE